MLLGSWKLLVVPHFSLDVHSMKVAMKIMTNVKVKVMDARFCRGSSLLVRIIYG